MAMNPGEAVRMVEAARKNRVFLMEAFMYRCHPQTEKLVELIRGNILGKIRYIRASFCFEAPLDLKHRLFNPGLGGGAILDVGCYPVSMARRVAGARRGREAPVGRPFVQPLEVRGSAVRGSKSQVDERALGVLKFPGGILAEISCAIRGERADQALGLEGE